jgi:hypothetical protein
MSANRLQNRIAWDHTVLVKTAPRLERRNVPRRAADTGPGGHPVATVVLAWVLIAWSMLTGWALWTRSDADAHISMRFLMRGEIEELLGVITGLLWACIPAWAGFFLARRVREITMDDLGPRAYWTSLVVSIIAALGILRPTWDSSAGSRFARVSPAKTPDTTRTTAADDGSFESSLNDGSNLLGPESRIAVADNLYDTGESPENSPAREGEPARWPSARALALLKAMAAQREHAGATYATVDTPDSPE